MTSGSALDKYFHAVIMHNFYKVQWFLIIELNSVYQYDLILFLYISRNQLSTSFLTSEENMSLGIAL